jgi:hypothetical protein
MGTVARVVLTDYWGIFMKLLKRWKVSSHMSAHGWITY